MEEAVKDERLSQRLVKNAEFYTNIMEILYQSTARYQGKITVTFSVLKCWTYDILSAHSWSTHIYHNSNASYPDTTKGTIYSSIYIIVLA